MVEKKVITVIGIVFLPVMHKIRFLQNVHQNFAMQEYMYKRELKVAIFSAQG